MVGDDPVRDLNGPSVDAGGDRVALISAPHQVDLIIVMVPLEHAEIRSRPMPVSIEVGRSTRRRRSAAPHIA